MDVYTSTGSRLTLVEPAIKSGGEGAIYNIKESNDLVAKIYISKSDASIRKDKIIEMSRLCDNPTFKNSLIMDSTAWPLAPLFDQNKVFIGFGMKRVNADYELDDVYALNSAKGAPFDMKQRLKVLINLCRIVDSVHKCGLIFGDMNPDNMKVNSNCEVQFVDTDSYHFCINGKEYPCNACAPGYVAPELIKRCKGMTYEDAYKAGKQTFNVETDRFALAIHCFRMLMYGCHPFNCQKLSTSLGSTPVPPIDRRVENGLTPFFVPVQDYISPKWAPDASSLPDYLRGLFKRAFVDAHTNPSLRPSAAEWQRALERYMSELTQCSCDSAHWYWNKHGKCPYCETNQKWKTYNESLNNRPKASTPGRQIAVASRVTGTGNNQNNRSNVPVNRPKVSKLKTFRFNTLKADTWLYWVISMSVAIIINTVMGINIYMPVYYMMSGYEEIGYIGAVLSALIGIFGAGFYNEKWSYAASHSGCHFKWYDYILCVIAGIGVNVILSLIATLAVSLFVLVVGIVLSLLGVIILVSIIVGFFD